MANRRSKIHLAELLYAVKHGIAILKHIYIHVSRSIRMLLIRALIRESVSSGVCGWGEYQIKSVVWKCFTTAIDSDVLLLLLCELIILNQIQLMQSYFEAPRINLPYRLLIHPCLQRKSPKCHWFLVPIHIGISAIKGGFMLYIFPIKIPFLHIAFAQGQHNRNSEK